MTNKPNSVLILLLLALLLLCILFGTAMAADAQTVFQTTAQSACVVEKTSGRVLFEKNAHQKLPMASTTKIVTALTVLKNCQNLDEVVEIPSAACGVEGSSVYLCAGEKLTVRELLYGLMLRSGNDCAVALALKTGGSVENFAVMMNDAAREAGCFESNFVNPHGLHDDNHYTTASDLAIASCAALKNSDFCEIVSTKNIKIANDGFDCQRLLQNKNKLLFSFDGADGVKTGYTKKAGRCFVGSATRNGMQVVVALLNCPPMFEEASRLLDAAFGRYKLQVAVPKNKLCGVEYFFGKPTYYYCETPFSYPISADEKLETKVVPEGTFKEITVSLKGKILFRSPLRAAE